MDRSSTCRSILLLRRFGNRFVHSTEEETSPMLVIFVGNGDFYCDEFRPRIFSWMSHFHRQSSMDGNVLLVRSFRSVHRWRWSRWESFASSPSLLSACLSSVTVIQFQGDAFAFLSDQFEWFSDCFAIVDRLEMRNQSSIAIKIDITRRRFQDQTRCFDEEFLSNSSIGQSSFDPTNNNVHHPTLGPMVKFLWPNGNERMMERWCTEGIRRGCEGHWDKETSGEGITEMVEQREEEEDKFYRSSKTNLPHYHTDQIEDVNINICLPDAPVHLVNVV